jgi:type VI secretion system secreted protein VgrG
MRIPSACLLFSSFWAVNAYAGGITLGTAGDFAVLAGSAVTNTGSSIVEGNVGVSPGSAITGFPPGSVIGTIYSTVFDNGAFESGAENDLTTAYNTAAGEPCTDNLSGRDLGGLTLTPGVYCYTSAGPAAELTGTLALNAQGNPNAVFIFQIAATLTTANSSSVVFINGGTGDDNLFWQVGSSATLGTDTAFAGNILADTSITLNTGASIDCGSALASSGAVTLDDNAVTGCAASSSAATPEPGSAGLLGMGLVFGLFLYGRQRVANSLNP